MSVDVATYGGSLVDQIDRTPTIEVALAMNRVVTAAWRHDAKGWEDDVALPKDDILFFAAYLRTSASAMSVDPTRRHLTTGQWVPDWLVKALYDAYPGWEPTAKSLGALADHLEEFALDERERIVLEAVASAAAIAATPNIRRSRP